MSAATPGQDSGSTALAFAVRRAAGRMSKTSASQFVLLLIVLLSVACALGRPVVVVHAFKEGLPGVRAVNADVRLSIASDPGVPRETLLVVDYPAASDDPAARDVQCAAE